MFSWWGNFIPLVMHLFFTCFNWWFFTEVVSNSNSPLFSWTLLDILADFKSGWSWFPLWSPVALVSFTDLGVPFKGTIYNWYHRHFHRLQFFQLSGKVQVFVYLFAFILIRFFLEQQNPSSFFFLLFNTRSGFLAGRKWSVLISQYQRILYISFSKTYYCLCKYHLSVWSNLNLLHNFLLITFPTQSCLSFYFFCAS